MGVRRTQLVAAVDEIKALKPDEIAALIENRKIKGRPGTTGLCPLASLLHGAHGGRFVVGPDFIIHVSGNHNKPHLEKVKTPPNLASFVRMFDKGLYGKLILPPPRCVPPRSLKPHGSQAHKSADPRTRHDIPKKKMPPRSEQRNLAEQVGRELAYKPVGGKK